jgi:sulfur carrier protein ThiS
MTVQVKLYALLRKYHPGPNRSAPLAVALSEGSTLADLIAVLKLPADAVRASFVNGEKLPSNTVMRDGDLVSLFSAVVGG